MQVTTKSAALVAEAHELDHEIRAYTEKLKGYAELSTEKRTPDVLGKEGRAKELVEELSMRLFNLRTVEMLKLEFCV